MYLEDTDKKRSLVHEVLLIQEMVSGQRLGNQNTMLNDPLQLYVLLEDKTASSAQ